MVPPRPPSPPSPDRSGGVPLTWTRLQLTHSNPAIVAGYTLQYDIGYNVAGIYTYGCPRVGNAAFAQFFAQPRARNASAAEGAESPAGLDFRSDLARTVASMSWPKR